MFLNYTSTQKSKFVGFSFFLAKNIFKLIYFMIEKFIKKDLVIKSLLIIVERRHKLLP